MIIIFPLVPILIALLIIFLSLLLETSEYAGVIAVVGWISVILCSVVLVACNMFRKTSTANKIAGSVISVIASVLSLVESNSFLSAISSVNSPDFFKLISFGFVLIFGGAVWLACVGLCAYASYNCTDDNGEGYLSSILSLVGSFLLALFFGLI